MGVSTRDKLHVDAVVGGVVDVSQAASEAVRTLIGDFVERAEAGETDLDGLTDRERQILEQIARGLTGREIAERLDISANTIDRHRSNIMAKLDLHNKAELVRYAALDKGLIETG